MSQQLAIYLTREFSDVPSTSPFVPGSTRFTFPIREAPEYDEPDFEVANDRYEASLVDFMCGSLSDAEEQTALVLIVRGGMGTGKTSVLKHCLRKAERTLDARLNGRKLRKLYLQFNDIESILLRNNARKDAEFIWGYISRHFEREFVKGLPPTEEIGKYWSWISEQPKVFAMLPCFAQIIEAYKVHIEAYARGDGYASMNNAQLGEFLVEQRVAVLRTADPIERHQYAMAKFLYREAQEAKPGQRSVVILDNVDHLPPQAQTQIIDVGFWLADSIRVPLIVAVRPLTWENCQGHRPRYLHDHCSPDIAAVAKSRMIQYTKKKSATEYEKALITMIVRELELEKSHLTRLLYGTSGISVRAGLKNLANFLLSPLVETELKKARPKLEPSQLSRAFFFGASEGFLEENFENLYSLQFTGDARMALLKGRILHRIGEPRHHCKSSELLDYVSAFGFSPDLVLLAINSLMRRSRSLIWSDHDFRFASVEDLRGPHNIAITPMGLAYMERLFGEYFYVESCMARSRADTVPPERMVEFSRALIVEDEKQVRSFVESARGASQSYSEYFPKNRPSLAFIYWSQFERGAVGRLGAESNLWDKGWRDRVLDFCRRNVDAATYA